MRNEIEEFIFKREPDDELWSLLSEEASELASASAKLARILRGVSPTPVRLDKAMENVVEELTDVFNVLDVLQVAPDSTIGFMKKIRWCERLQERDNAV